MSVRDEREAMLAEVSARAADVAATPADPLARALRAEARRLREEAAGRLPSAESLLWRARLRERTERVERASRFLALYDRLALGLGSALLLGLAVARREVIAAWWASGTGGASIAEASASPAAGEAWLAVTAVLVVTGLVVALANLHGDGGWARD